MESDLTRPGYTWGFQFFHKMFLLIRRIYEKEADLFFVIVQKDWMFQANRDPEKDSEVLKKKKINGLEKDINKNSEVFTPLLHL